MENGNLVITRKELESFWIGERIHITVVAIGANKVRLHISAPKDLNIVRSELNTQTKGE